MFYNDPHLDTMSQDAPPRSWGTERISINRFGIVPSYNTESRPTIQKPIVKYLNEQAQLINTDRTPREDLIYPIMSQFFEYHRMFSEGLNELIIQSSSNHFSRYNFYDTISDIISEYDQNLAYLPDYILDIFCNYTDLLEGVLLVSKRRHIEIIELKDILTKLSNCYSKIYSLMISSRHKDISSIIEELSRIKEEIGNRNLLPTVEECEAEMEETFATMNDEEKEDLARLLRTD